MKNIANFSLRRQFIDTPQARRVFERLNEVHQDTLRSKTSKGLMLQGLSGSGKTTTVRQYLSSVFPTPNVPGKVLRALRVEIPSSPSKKNLATAMLTALDDPFASSRSHSAETKFTRIVTLLRNLQTEIIILDEAQHLVDYSRTNTYEAADWIKSLMNETEITIVLVGLRRTQRLLWANEQLRRRLFCQRGFGPL
ncbi:TniB family NTP-binding protein [Cupriavidus sp. CuC1]|uniref:TniB family NTP-binding protein n=1 Tax=Cupriavidus sp. CuC1 TaxID=3373131 RepID=UPI0037D62320